MDDSSSLYTSVPIVFAEIRPLHWIEETDDDEKEQHHSRLTNFGVKRFLLGETQRFRAHRISGFVAGSDTNDDGFCIRWKDSGTTGDGLSSGYIDFSNGDDSSHEDAVPVLYIPSDNPIVVDRQPCCVIAYAYPVTTAVASCHFTEDTLVRILPPRLATKSHVVDNTPSARPIPRSFPRDTFLSELLGEDISEDDDEMMEQVLQSHNPETIDELTLKLSAATVSVRIGTTVDAIRVWEQHQRQLEKLQNSIQAFCGGEVERPTSNNTGLQSWPSLIVHSPRHADGKTLLVQALAKKRLGMVVHCVRPGALLAKYGVRADAALESQIHGMLVSAACRNQTVCLLLDPLDAMVLSRRSSAGDAAGPVLNAMASYLRSITNSMQRKQQFPFPSKNPLYNPTCANTGQVLTANLCLVGIVTCPDDGWKSSTSGSSSILDCMVSDRYRLPLLTTTTIISAFEAAFHREGISLEPAASAKLALLAGSSPWMRGGIFGKVAKEVRGILKKTYSTTATAATVKDLSRAMDRVKAELNAEPAPKGSFDEPEDETSSTQFASIGGNVQAKMSLEDALAFDPLKRELLAKFGLSPPTGVLLYGPPGCGKTLLAKAVARLLKSSNSSGGTFLSLKISEIVSSEVGTSEKTIAASFEFAEKNAPSVIFLDEFQALFTDRNRGGGGKLTTTLLQCLDDIKRWYDLDKTVKSDQKDDGGKRVIVIGATNTPWMIDSAFLRPGRFDRVVHVGLPSRSELRSILLVHIQRMRVHDSGNIDSLCQDLSILTEGFSGADIAALCRAAAIRALEEDEHNTVKDYHFKEALKHDVCPSSDDDLVKRLSMWRP